jgi:uncharacterized protein (TIGR02594 family)
MTTLASCIPPIGFSQFPWMRFALQEISQAEIRGPRHNPRILEYQKAGHNNGDEAVPWCSAFANWCMVHGGHQGSGLPNARSWLTWGEPLAQPIYGCVTVFTRPPRAWQGHVGFFVGADAGTIWVLGGNQRGSSGGEVSIGAYERSRLLGFRWPTGFSRPDRT